MDSTKSLSNLSLSSIAPDNNPNNEDTEALLKSNLMTKIIAEALSTTNAENTALANEKLKLLNELGIDLKLLPADIKERLQIVAAILKSEGLSTVDEDALQVCLEERNFNSMVKEREERLLKAKYNAAFATYSVIQEKITRLRKDVEELENLLQSNDEETTEIRVLLSSKMNDYKATVKKLEKELYSIKSEEIALDKILQKSSELSDNLSTLDELNSGLEKYGDLPANLLQAKYMLNSKRKELEEIENSILEKMND